MKKTIVLLLLAIILTACGNSEAAIEREKETETLFNKNCAGCHGLDLNGTQLGSSIKGFSKNEILTAIEEGAEGMDANILTGDDAQRVATWISKQK